MTFTYTNEPNSTGTAQQKVDAVRLLLQDTTETRQLFSDEEITWAVGESHNIYLAAAMLADVSTGRARGVKSKHVGDTRIEYLATRAPMWRARGLHHQKPFAGGISESDKDILEENSDWPQRKFEHDLFDDPQADDRSTDLEDRDP